MKKTWFLIVSLLACTIVLAQPKPKAPVNKGLANAKDSLSYALGVSIAQNLQSQGLDDINPTVLARAIANARMKKPHAIAPEACGAYINQYMQKDRTQKIEANKLAGTRFLTANAKKAGVNTLPSGLQYQIIKQGEGAKPVPTDKVKCHYHGTLIDGTVFDSSVERGEPAVFPVNGVIAGWTEALQLMPVGSKWRLFIPSGLAYGDVAAGQKIGPGSTLIFDVELLDIVK